METNQHAFSKFSGKLNNVINIIDLVQQNWKLLLRSVQKVYNLKYM